MPIKPPHIDKNGYQYSPEVQTKIDASIREKAIELSQSYQPSPEPMQSIGYEVKPVSEEKKPYQKPELKSLQPEDVPAEVKAEFDKALAGKSQGGIVTEHKPEPLHNNDQTQFSPTFDVRVFSTVIREVMIFRMNQMALVNTQEHFWQAQHEVTKLRAKLQTAYNSAIQKARMKKPARGLDEPVHLPPDIWCFGAAAYDLITEQGMRLADVLEMSGAKLAQLAEEQRELFKAKAEKEGDAVYMIRKKSREK